MFKRITTPVWSAYSAILPNRRVIVLIMQTHYAPAGLM